MTRTAGNLPTVTTTAGIEMPKLIYGTAWKKERTENLVMKAVRAGFRGLDTACQPRHYREELVGAALQRMQTQGIARQELFLQTKFTPLAGHGPGNVPYDQNAPLPIQVVQSFEVSKQNLRTDYVDSLVLHSPLSSYRDLLTVWRALEKIYETGGARQLGISNCHDLACLKRLYDDASVRPAIVQNRFYRETGYDAPLRQWCQAHNIIYQSFWTLTANPLILSSQNIQSLARRYAKTSEQIFFRFLSQMGVVPLTGTCSEQHMREDLGIFDFELHDDERETIETLFR